MRVLLSTIGSRGDVQPLVALALELRALGHEVLLCVPPDFREWIEGFGLPVLPIGPEVRKAAVSSRPANSAAPSPEQVRQFMEATVATQFEAIATAAQGCDVIVGATALQVAAPSIAEKMGIPYYFAAYCPIVLPSAHHAPPPLPPVPGQPVLAATTNNRELWARDTARFNDAFREPLNSSRAAVGLAPVDDVRSYMFSERPWVAADRVLAPWPDAADERVYQPGAWILPDDRPLPDEVQAFLVAGEPPVYFGFGSTGAPHDLSQVMIESARAASRRAVISRGWADLSLLDDQPDCLAIDEVNLQALFTRVAAVVHHGGAGTTTLAALAGAPQTIVPQIYDQHYWAQRVHALGIGTAHAPGSPTADSLTSALLESLTPDMAARARSIASHVSRVGARTAAQHLVSVATAPSQH